MRVHHTFGIARGTRREKHGGHIFWSRFFNFCFEKSVMFCCKRFATVQQSFQTRQTWLSVFAQTAWVVKINIGQLRALLTNLQQLVDLLLVFGEGEAHVGVVDRENAL